MIYDWKTNKEEAIENGICEKEFFGITCVIPDPDTGVVNGHTFKNFPKLEFAPGTLVTDCTFESCQDLTFDECRINNCIFNNTEFLFCRDSNFTNCRFSDSSCADDVLISIEDCKISHCGFSDIRLENDVYMIDGVGDCHISHCDFSNILTTREDREIIISEETKGTIFKRKVRYFITDEDTCKGLDEVKLIHP